MRFEIVKAVYDDKGRRSLVPTGEPDVTVACDEVLVAVGQENAFPWIERDMRHRVRQMGPAGAGREDLPVHVPKVFFGGDAAFGPKNIITAVAHGHEAAVSIDRFLHGETSRKRPPPTTNLVSQKMGIHEWSYDNAPSNDTAPQGALGARPRRRWPASRSRSNSASTPPPPSRKPSAA
jgi:formate dehydrogenase beta subunit